MRQSTKGRAVIGQLWLTSFLAGYKTAVKDISGQAMVAQAGPGTLGSSDGNGSTDSQVVLGVTNVHVDALVLYKGTIKGVWRCRTMKQPSAGSMLSYQVDTKQNLVNSSASP